MTEPSDLELAEWIDKFCDERDYYDPDNSVWERRR